MGYILRSKPPHVGRVPGRTPASGHPGEGLRVLGGGLGRVPTLGSSRGSGGRPSVRGPDTLDPTSHPEPRGLTAL